MILIPEAKTLYLFYRIKHRRERHVAGIIATAPDLLVFCDEENVLNPRYLEIALHRMEKQSRFGIASLCLKIDCFESYGYLRALLP